MRAIILSILLCIVLSAFSQQSGRRIEKLINTNWTFNYFPEEKVKQKYPGFNDRRWNDPKDPIWSKILERPEYDDSNWGIVSIPHTWSTYETTGELHPYIKNASNRDNSYWWDGVGWYRKRFTVEKSLEGKKVFVEFEGVQKNCRVYINGKPMAEHFGGYTGFSVDLTDYINFGGENVLAVSVSNKQDDDYKVAPMSGGCWNVYGGIYRNVKLVVTDKLYVPYAGSAKFEGGTFFTTPIVEKSKALLDMKTWVKNEYTENKECRLTTTIFDKTGKVVAKVISAKMIVPFYIEMFQQEVEVPDPLLWNTDTPNMYHAVSEIAIEDKTVDIYQTDFGIREFRWDFDTNTLFINGEEVNIRGFNRHQEYPWLGDAIPDFIHDMDLRDIKENLNCNFIRPGQYISAPYVYDLCDKIGLITCGEFPNVKDFDFTLEFQETYARELIRQYRNHPSILLWDIGDESNRAADSRWVYEEDNTRYISCRDCPGPSPGKFINLPSKSFRLSKMLNCNVRGWYDDDEMNIRPLNQQHATNEQHRHEAARSSQDGTSNNRIDQSNLVVWLYEDHGCDRRYQNAPLLFYNPKGWVDSYRVPKYSYYLWQANYCRKPMIFIHPQFWRAQYIGQKKDIEIDSNCESVELKINGHRFGIKKPSNENFHVVKFENVPIENGTLTAIGKKDGQHVEQELHITGEPAVVSLKSSHSQITAAQNSIAIITADILDNENNHIFGARNTVRWEVTGPATLVGYPVYQSDFGKRMDTNGTLYIDMPVSNVIRSTGEPGTIVVRVFAAGLKMGEVSIDAVRAPVEADNGIIEHILNQAGREIVIQNSNEVMADNEEVLPVVREQSADLRITAKQNVPNVLTQTLAENNPLLNAESAEFSALINILTKICFNGEGVLYASELNYNINNFNRFSTLKQIIDKTGLPEKMKSDLKEYFLKELISYGNEVNIEREKKKLLTVSENSVVLLPGTKEKIPGVISTESLDIHDIVGRVYSRFNTLNTEEKEHYLKYLSDVNPWVKRIFYLTGDAKLGTRQEHISYRLTAGKAIFIPDIQL